MSTFQNRKSRKGVHGVRATLKEITLQRVRQGFANEEILLRALTQPPEAGENPPGWFGSFRRAKPEDDLRRATDFYLSATVVDGDGTIRKFEFPVNAKSSPNGVAHLRAGRHNAARLRQNRVPIFGFVVDPSSKPREIRASFFETFEEDADIRRWLASRALELGSQEEPQEKPSRQPSGGESAVRSTLKRVLDNLSDEVASCKILSAGELDDRARALCEAEDLSPEARRVVLERVRDRSNSLPLHQAIEDLRKRARTAIRAAREAAESFQVALTVDEARAEIGSAFGQSFREFCRELPQAAGSAVESMFLSAAATAFNAWRHRRAKEEPETRT